MLTIQKLQSKRTIKLVRTIDGLGLLKLNQLTTDGILVDATYNRGQDKCCYNCESCLTRVNLSDSKNVTIDRKCKVRDMRPVKSLNSCDKWSQCKMSGNDSHDKEKCI